MLAEFSIVPIGIGAHLSKAVSDLVGIVKQSGLDYRLTAMGTIIEGNYDQVMDVIKRCHQKALELAPRVITNIRIDDFKGRSGQIEGKVKAVEQALKGEVKKQ